jgi:hypothetical protein
MDEDILIRIYCDADISYALFALPQATSTTGTLAQLAFYAGN